MVYQKKIILIGLAWLVFCSACSGPYLKNRLHDAGDIFTAEVQTQSYGASLYLSVFNLGASYKPQTGTAFGLRGGQFGRYNSAGFTALAFGSDYFTASVIDFNKNWKPIISEKEKQAILLAKNKSGSTDITESPLDMNDAQKKEKDLALNKLNDPANLIHKRGKNFRARLPLGTQKAFYKNKNLLRDKKTKFVAGYLFTRLELQLGAWLGVRLGFNPGELLDFILGWTTLDIYSDDAPYDDSLMKKLKANPQFKKLSPEMQKKFIEQLRKRGSSGLPLKL